MKKIFKRVVGLILVYVSVLSFIKDKPIYDSNINIKDLLNYKGKIKMICSFEYCDYLNGANMEDSIENFMINYLKTIKNEEIKNTLKVKGIKITKIILD